MIDSVSGILKEKSPTFVVVEAGGIGYGISISLPTFESLGDVGEAVSLATYLHVREDILALYGFANPNERRMFLALVGVSGIGPKLALGILSGMPVPMLCDCILNGDSARIKKIPGVGTKTAERLVLELKSKVSRFAVAGPGTPTPVSPFPFRQEALLALQSLGYKEADAEKALEAVFKESGPPSALEELIRNALQLLV